MSRFKAVDPADDPAVKAVYDEVEAAGFSPVPNWFTSMSSRPDLMAMNFQLSQSLLMNGQLPPSIGQMVVLAVSVQNKCKYCTVAHSAQARMVGVPDDVVAGLADGLDLAKLAPVDRTLVSFALKAARDPNSVEQADVDQLREQGLSDGEIMELIMLVGYTHLINTWSDVSAIETDLMWQK
jgi:uncharacterized peroxidase-related enzyme